MVKQRTAEPQNIEPQNFEGWNRCALSFKSIKIDRSTQRLSTGRIPSLDIRYSTFTIRYLSAFGGFVFFL
jgi:hypothetical protein